MKADTLIPRGASIGRYVVRGWIARGAMGEVYAAYDPNLDRKLAIKLVRVERGFSSGDVDARTRLMREAQAIAKLSHPNVVIVHDVGTHEDRVFIAMEFIDGGTLTFWLNAKPRTWREILKVFIAAGRGLQHAHEANLVHRDFKPENVMIRLDGEVRVMDFGLVRYVDAVEAENETAPATATLSAGPPPARDDVSIDSTVNIVRPARGPAGSAEPGPQQVKLTQTGVMMGTPAYMAPEQFRGQIADARSDQFSFCVALYEALYGHRPFPGSTMAALATNVLTGQLIPPPERTEVPVIVWQTLRRGLSVAAADRYPSMSELLADLARVPEPLRRNVPNADTLATTADLASMLETLLARPVQAKQQTAKPSVDQGVVAVYGGDDGVPTALLHFDLPAAGSTAAALTLVPQNVVKEAARVGKLPQMLMDNLLEV
ncbi:MAG: eukaryotic-like serine/threonine-protein kinase, partial [Myxococcales bacterium]|nr:eukaryotic-like serine/threonine-protein kinase [Myxococcales bacterium]